MSRRALNKTQEAYQNNWINLPFGFLSVYNGNVIATEKKRKRIVYYRAGHRKSSISALEARRGGNCYEGGERGVDRRCNIGIIMRQHGRLGERMEDKMEDEC